jgi:hypothetical protein
METGPMRRGLWLGSLLLPLTGCYVAPSDPGYGYAQPGYPSPPPGYPLAGYPPPSYPPGGYYAPAPYDPYAGGYPGYSCNSGAPTILEGGVAMPLVLFGGEWGFYDRDRHWHRAPEGVSRDLEAHRAGGGQFRPGAAPRAEAYPRSGQPAGQAAYRPAGQPQPSAAPPGAPRAAEAGRPQPTEYEHRHDCQSGQRC